MAKASSVLFHGVVDGFADEVELDERVDEVFFASSKNLF